MRNLLAAVLLLAWGTLQADILTVLPEQKRKQHTFPPQSFIVRSKEHFRYEFEHTEQPTLNITDLKNAEVGSFCNFKAHEMNMQEIQSFDFSGEQLDSNSFDSSSVTVSYQQGLIYFINSQLKITAFYFNNTHLVKAASQKISVNRSIDEEKSGGSVLLTSEDGKFVFVFTQFGIWRIDTRGVLSSVQKLDTHFNWAVNEGLVTGQLMVVGSVTSGMLVFQVDVTGGLTMVAHFNRFDRTEIHPVSLAMNKQEGLIYLLDQAENIYVYKVLKGRVSSYDIISFKHSGNLKIRAEGPHLLYSFVENNNFKICELIYNYQTKQAELVRYYKLFDYITDFFVHGREMLVFSSDLLDWFPIGVDPRLIKRQHNGVRVQSSARRVVKLSDELFLLSDDKSLKLSWLRVHPPRLECFFGSKHSKVLITSNSNISSCSGNEGLTVDTSYILPGNYNQYCEVLRQISIDVDIPEQQQRQSIMVYAAVAVFIVLFLLGLFCLLQWRNSRVEVIDYVTDKIKQYQQKKKMVHRKLEEEEQPRSEERRGSRETPDQQPVEIEMQPPEVLADNNPRTDEQLVK